jgi:hypothetical protein
MIVLALLLVLFSLPAFADTKANIPDWVRQAAGQQLPPYPPDTDAVVLLSEETDTVTAPDEHIEHYRRVVKILRPDGRNEGDLRVWIGHEGKLNSIHGWSIDAAGHEYEIKDKDFETRGDAYCNMYRDVYQKWARAPGAGAGAIIAFEYDLRRRDYFGELNWMPQEDIPVRSATLTIQMPSGWELKDWWSGPDSAKSTTVGPNGWQWTKTNLPAIEDEQQRPASDALAARLTVQLFTATRPLGSNWAAVSRWAAGLFNTQRTTSPEMIGKVAQLTQGKNDFDSKVRVITEFVQTEFRYYAIEIGIGGFQPHPASDVFNLRYGDCKDKANTLLTMLLLAGVKSEAVLIHTDRGIVRPESPSTYFNHAILAVELPAGLSSENYSSAITAKSGKQYVLFDPTDQWMPFGQIRSELQDSYALIISDSGGELIRVPVATPSATQLVRSARLTLTPEGTLSGRFEEELTGDFAEQLRMGAESANQQQQLQHYEHLVARSLKNASVHDLAFDGLKELNRPVDVHYTVSADRYAQIMGSLMIVRPRVLGVKTIGLERDRKPRKYPLVLGNTALERDEFEVKIPAGYTVDDKPEPVKVETAFANYKSQVEVNGDKLRYSREYVRKSIEIPADQIEEYRAFERRVAADENAAVVFKKVAVPAGQ